MKIHAIYTIRNIESGKRYIGSAVDYSGRKRMHLHQLRHGKHHNVLLQRAWVKHGAAAFAFEVIEQVANPGDLLSREQWWLDHYRSADPCFGYNILKVAGSNLGKRRSPEAIAKQAQSWAARTPEQIEELRQMRRAARLGYKHSEETLAKMRGQKRSDETRRRIGDAHRGRTVPEDRRQQISATLTGRKIGPQSAEVIAKRVAATRATKEAKRRAACQ